MAKEHHPQSSSVNLDMPRFRRMLENSYPSEVQTRGCTCVATFLDGAADQVVPHLNKTSSSDFRNRGLRGKCDLTEFGPGSYAADSISEETSAEVED